MKPRTVLCLAALLVTLIIHVSSAQEYDFKTGEFRNVGSLKFGQMVQLKVKNINTFRYKLTINGVQVDYVTPVPSELQALFRLPEPTEAVKKATEGLAKSEAAKEDMKDLAGKAGVGTFKTEMTELERRCALFIAEAKDIRAIKFRRAELISLAKQKWPDHSTLSGQLPSPTMTRPAMYKHVEEFFDTYEAAKTQYMIALDEAQDKDKKRIEDALDRFEEGYEEVEEGDLLQYVEDVDVLQTALTEDDNFTFLSPPVQADGDFLSFDITIEPDRTNALLPHEAKTTSRIEIPVRGGWKADFSVGPNFSLGPQARDDKYYLEPTAAGKGKLMQGTNSNAVRPSVAAMLHAYPRTGKNFAVGPLLGVGAGFKADAALTAAYFLGASVILGKRQRLMGNVGASFLPVERLKAAYQTGKEYEIESTKIADITEKVLRPSFFFGISYNITNRVELK